MIGVEVSADTSDPKVMRRKSERAAEGELSNTGSQPECMYKQRANKNTSCDISGMHHETY